MLLTPIKIEDQQELQRSFVNGRCDAYATDSSALAAFRFQQGDRRNEYTLLPEVMRESDRRAKAVDRACTDAVEAAVLRRRVGEVFDAVVVDENHRGDLVVQLTEPAVTALASGQAAPGDEVRVELTLADVTQHLVRFVVREVTGRQ